MKLEDLLKLVGYIMLILASSTTAITVHPHVQALKGQNATLHCSVENADNPLLTTFTWTKGDSDQTVASYVSGFPSLSGSLEGRAIIEPPILVIIDARISDAGQYTCMAIVPGQTPTRATTSVTVQASPTLIIESKQPQKVSSDGTYVPAICHAQRGFPTPVVEWIDTDTKEVQLNVEKNVTALPDGTTSVDLHLKLTPGLGVHDDLTSLLSNDVTIGRKNFTCRVQHPEITDSNETPVQVDLLYAPLVEINIQSNRLSCVAKGNPTPQLTWILPDNSEVKNQKDIIIDQSKPNKSRGRYTCVARNSIQPYGVASMHIDKPSKMPVMFTSTLTYNTSIAQNTNNYNIPCSVQLKPRDSSEGNFVVWYKDEKVIENDSSVYKIRLTEEIVSNEISIITSTLTIQNVKRRRDDGIFACKVGTIVSDGFVSAVERSIDVTVDYPPNNAVTSVSASPTWEINEGGKIRLECRSEGKPSPEYRWYLNGRKVSDKRVLVLRNISRNEAGKYECYASNYVAGSGRADNELFVKYPPSNVTIAWVGGNTLQCVVNSGSHPPPTYTWTFPNGTSITGNHSYIKLETMNVAVESQYLCHVTNFMSNPVNASFTILPPPAAKIGSLTVVEFVFTLLACLFLLAFIICAAFCLFRFHLAKKKAGKDTINLGSKRHSIRAEYSEPQFSPQVPAQDESKYLAPSDDSSSEDYQSSECTGTMPSYPAEMDADRTRPTFSTFSTLPNKPVHNDDGKMNDQPILPAYEDADTQPHNSPRQTTKLLPVDQYSNRSGQPTLSDSSATSHRTLLFDGSSLRRATPQQNKLESTRNETFNTQVDPSLPPFVYRSPQQQPFNNSKSPSLPPYPMVAEAVRLNGRESSLMNSYYGTSSPHKGSTQRMSHAISPSPYDSGPDSVNSGSTGTTSTSKRVQALTLV